MIIRQHAGEALGQPAHFQYHRNFTHDESLKNYNLLLDSITLKRGKRKPVLPPENVKIGESLQRQMTICPDQALPRLDIMPLLEANRLEQRKSGGIFVTFRLFNHIDQLALVANLAATDAVYRLLGKLRAAAQGSDWAAYANFADYARICFWAIRKHEYSFIAEAFAKIEAETDHPLRVLDVGCGVVPMCNWISSRGHQVVAFDPLEADIEFLVRNNLNAFYDSNVAYYLGRGEHLPFADLDL